jgi:hypothetical protein
MKGSTTAQVTVNIVEWIFWITAFLFFAASAIFDKPHYIIYVLNIIMVSLMIPFLDFEDKKSRTDQAGMAMLANYQIMAVMLILIYDA